MHLKTQNFQYFTFRQLGEPCDNKILIDHYGKHGATYHSETGMDFKSESAAIYVLVS